MIAGMETMNVSPAAIKAIRKAYSSYRKIDPAMYDRLVREAVARAEQNKARIEHLMSGDIAVADSVIGACGG